MRVLCSCCVQAVLKITLRAEDITTLRYVSEVAVSAFNLRATGKVVYCKMSCFNNPNVGLLLIKVCYQ